MRRVLLPEDGDQIFCVSNRVSAKLTPHPIVPHEPRGGPLVTGSNPTVQILWKTTKIDAIERV